MATCWIMTHSSQGLISNITFFIDTTSNHCHHQKKLVGQRKPHNHWLLVSAEV